MLDSGVHPTKRDDIQGLRALAVGAVVLYHASHSALPGGFAGVDIFFVISGYLISQILLKSMDGQTFSLRDFYKRRIRRLFPALYTVLLVTLVLGLIILPPQLLKELVYTQFFTNLFLSNFAFLRLSGYFDSSAALKPLLHTWSLGVEEQFYLLFPPILLFLHRFARRILWPVLAVLAVVSLVFAQHLMKSHVSAAFYHPMARAFELLIGALCVGVQKHVKLGAKLRLGLSLVGMAVLIASIALLNDQVPFPGVMALPPCLGAAALLLSLDGLGNRWLSVKPLVVIGDMSYSLYLWHWPLLVFGHMVFGLSWWVSAIAVILAVGLAWLSRRYIEAPFLDGRPWPVWRLGLGAMAVSIVVCLLIYQGNGLPQRFNVAQQAVFAASDDFNHDRPKCHKRSDGTLPYEKTCIYGDKAEIPSVAVWSDSQGAEMARVLGEALTARHQSLRSITASGCPPSLIDPNPDCRTHNAAIMAHVLADTHLHTVVLTANYLRYEDPPALPQKLPMPEGLLQTAARLQAAGKQVIIVYPIPIYYFDPPSQVGMAMRLGHDPRALGMSAATYDHDNGPTIAKLDAFAAAHHIAVLRSRDVLCDQAFCHVYDPKIGVLYFNEQHLSLTGERLLANRLVTMTETVPPAR